MVLFLWCLPLVLVVVSDAVLLVAPEASVVLDVVLESVVLLCFLPFILVVDVVVSLVCAGGGGGAS